MPGIKKQTATEEITLNPGPQQTGRTNEINKKEQKQEQKASTTRPNSLKVPQQTKTEHNI